MVFTTAVVQKFECQRPLSLADPLMSSTLNAEDILGKKNSGNSAKSQNNTEPGEAGRPEKPDDQKSEKTIANKESMG